MCRRRCRVTLSQLTDKANIGRYFFPSSYKTRYTLHKFPGFTTEGALSASEITFHLIKLRVIFVRVRKHRLVPPHVFIRFSRGNKIDRKMSTRKLQRVFCVNALRWQDNVTYRGTVIIELVLLDPSFNLQT